MSGQIDILMITHARPHYTRLALSRLLETCDATMRVWLWHNGEHGETLEVVKSLANHPSVHDFHHSRENRHLREPTNWLWRHATGAYLSKIDDDCLMPDGWAQRLRAAHELTPQLGVIGCWRFQPEDFILAAAEQRIIGLAGGHKLLRNLWVEGSGYLMKRGCADQQGPIAQRDSFTRYCIRLAARGWLNGWYFPFLCQEHMDDPRSPHTLLKSDEDLLRNLPLTAARFGVRSLSDWQRWVSQDARTVQTASLDPKHYIGWYSSLRRLGRRLASA